MQRACAACATGARRWAASWCGAGSAPGGPRCDHGIQMVAGGRLQCRLQALQAAWGSPAQHPAGARAPQAPPSRPLSGTWRVPIGRSSASSSSSQWRQWLRSFARRPWCVGLGTVLCRCRSWGTPGAGRMSAPGRDGGMIGAPGAQQPPLPCLPIAGSGRQWTAAPGGPQRRGAAPPPTRRRHTHCPVARASAPGNPGIRPTLTRCAAGAGGGGGGCR